MDILLDKIVFPVIVGVIVGIITNGFNAKNQGVAIDIRSISRVKPGGITSLFVIVLTIYLFSLIAPYQVQNVIWCQDDQSIKIEGQITKFLSNKARPNESIQIQIFDAVNATTDAIEPGVIARSDNSGNFSSSIEKTAATWSTKKDMYVVNLGYWYKDILGIEHFSRTDTKFSMPGQCK